MGSLVRNRKQRDNSTLILQLNEIDSFAFRVRGSKYLVIYWGDGNIEEITIPNPSVDFIISHSYSTQYTGEVKIVSNSPNFSGIAISSPLPVGGANRYIGIKLPHTNSLPNISVLDDSNSGSLYFDCDFSRLGNSLITWYANRGLANPNQKILNVDVTDLATRFPLMRYLRLNGNVAIEERSRVRGILNSYPPNMSVWITDSTTSISSGMTISNPAPVPPDTLQFLRLGGEMSFDAPISMFNNVSGYSVQFPTWSSNATATGKLFGSWQDYNPQPEFLAGVFFLFGSVSAVKSDVTGDLTALFSKLKANLNSQCQINGNHGATTLELDTLATNLNAKSGITLNIFQLTDCPNTNGSLPVSANNPFPTTTTFTMSTSLDNFSYSGDVGFFQNCKATTVRAQTNFNTYTSGTVWRSDLTTLTLQGTGGTGLNTTDTDNLLIDLDTYLDPATISRTITIRSEGRTATSDDAFNALTARGVVITLN